MMLNDDGTFYCAGSFDATIAGQGYPNLLVKYDQAMIVLSTIQFNLIAGALEKTYDIDQHYLFEYIYGVSSVYDGVT